MKYIGLLCRVLFLQPGFGVVGLEAADKDTEAVVIVSPVWDKESVGTFRTDTCRKNTPSPRVSLRGRRGLGSKL